MYVRKFEADTIEEALKDIKRELGPEAVILKTITNKGSRTCRNTSHLHYCATVNESRIQEIDQMEILDFGLVTDYIYLDVDERKRFAICWSWVFR